MAKPSYTSYSFFNLYNKTIFFSLRFDGGWRVGGGDSLVLKKMWIARLAPHAQETSIVIWILKSIPRDKSEPRKRVESLEVRLVLYLEI